MIACWPTNESGTVRLEIQKSPRPLWLTIGKMFVQLNGSCVLVVTRKSQLAWGCDVWDVMLKAPAVTSETLLKLMSKPPQGAVPSLSSSKPREGGELRMKWAKVDGRRARRPRDLYMSCGAQ